MQNTANLKVAGVARELAVSVYLATRSFPSDERFGMIAQMRRASVSIGSNIAEGCGREGDRALVSFLQISMGSASELEFQIELANALSFLDADASTSLLAETRELKRMLASLISALRRKLARPRM